MFVDRLNPRITAPLQAAGLTLLLAGFQAGCNQPNPVIDNGPPANTVTTSEAHGSRPVESAIYQVGNQPKELSLPVALPDELTRIHANIGKPSPEFISLFEKKLVGAVYKLQYKTLQIKEGEMSIEHIQQRTGFVVTPDGLTLTVQHGSKVDGIPEPGSELELGQQIAMTGAIGQHGIGTVVQLFPDFDLAVIKADNYRGQYIPLGDIGTKNIGDMVIMPGFLINNNPDVNGGMSVPYGQYLGGGTKLVSSADGLLLPGVTMGIATAGYYEPGLSGAPVIGADGKAYGIVEMATYNPRLKTAGILANRVDERFLDLSD